MKTLLISTLFISLSLLKADDLAAYSGANNENAASGKLDITISYVRQSGSGSNQYAVWVENAAGEIVKTLYVTKYTAEGGYVPRPACIPMWVGKAKPATMTKQQIDAFSGATPQSGDHVYSWDLTDSNGNAVKAGKYTYFVEANLYGDSMVLFKGEIDVSANKQFSIKLTPQYNSESTRNKEIITSVNASYSPK